MRRTVVLGLFLAVIAEILFFAALNLFDDWTLEGMPTKFVATAFFCGVAYLIAVSVFKIHFGLRRQAIVFWSVAVILRVIALPLAPGDNLWRCEWEGKIQRAGFNPYLIAPADSHLDGLRHDFPEASKINRPELAAGYPPGAELLFRWSSGFTDRPIFYKIIFSLADLATACVLLRLIGGEHRYSRGVWYAWNPLVVYSFAGAAHFDSLMVLPLVGGILSLVKSNMDPNRKWFWALSAAILFGVAISIKLVPALLLLLCIFALRWRASVLPVSALIPVALSFPFGFPKVRIWESFGQFASTSRSNDLFWWVLEDTFWPNPHQKNYHYGIILIGCVIGVSFLFMRDWKRGTFWALGTALVLSPVLHPWYCTWILPLATWRRAYAWHVLSITVFAYYLFWDERRFDLPWHAEPWMRGLIILPVIASLIILGLKRKTAVAPAA